MTESRLGFARALGVLVAGASMLAGCGPADSEPLDETRLAASGGGGGDGTTCQPSCARGTLQVALGVDHSCAVSYQGKVKCWGGNGFGQLGIGSQPSQPLPADVTLNGQVRELALGVRHSCARTLQGRVFCWGSNVHGQLGIGSTGSSSVPVEVPDLIGVVQIASGGMHTCARTQAGEVYCWGRNESGAIGDGTNVDRTTPTLVPGIAAVDIAAGGSWFHDTTCAVLQSGAVRCWGSNGLGQVGDGTTIDRSLPASVPLRGAVEVATAAENSCARLASGDVYCWGNDAWGSVGNGAPDDGTVVTSPKRAGTTLKSHVIDLSMGSYYHEGSHACAIVGASADAESGHARCWGWGLSGQLGISSSPEFANVPKQVVGFGGSSVRSIVAGGSHSCSLRGTPYADDGLELWCWGANQHGQLGIGTTGGYEYISVFVPVNW